MMMIEDRAKLLGPEYWEVAFGRIVRHSRQSRGWSISRLAAQSGIAPSTLGRAERGQRGLSHSQRQAVIETLSHEPGFDRELGVIETSGAAELDRAQDRPFGQAGTYLAWVQDVTGLETVAAYTSAATANALEVTRQQIDLAYAVSLAVLIDQLEQIAEDHKGSPAEDRAEPGELAAEYLQSLEETWAEMEQAFKALQASRNTFERMREHLESLFNHARSPGREVRDQTVRRSPKRQTWDELLGPLLTEREVQELLGLKSTTEVRQLEQAGKLLSLQLKSGEVRYPKFQFDNAGNVEPIIPKVLSIFGDSVASAFTIASWLRSPKPHLDNYSPLEWLERGNDPDRVIGEAEESAARLAS